VILVSALVLAPVATALSVVLSTPEAAFAATTTVRPGDTLTSIAARYHTTVAALTAANHITNPNLVLAGTTLQVPPAPGASTVSTVAVAASAQIVVVRPGDTLTSIAARYHTTVAALMAANHITNANVVYAGAHLALPGPVLPPGWGPGGPLPTTLLAHPDRLALRPSFLSAASASGIAPSLLEALCWWESGWQSGVTSTTGAVGLCQLEPATVTYARTLLHNPALDPRVPADNIAMAAAYLHDLAVHDGGDLHTTVAAYYQGLSSVATSGLMPSTKVYVTGIFNFAGVFWAAG
jgi:LysM repeat protein